LCNPSHLVQPSLIASHQLSLSHHRITQHHNNDRQPRAQGKMHLRILISQISYVGLAINRNRQSHYPLKPCHTLCPHSSHHDMKHIYQSCRRYSRQSARLHHAHAAGTTDYPACSHYHPHAIGTPDNPACSHHLPGLPTIHIPIPPGLPTTLMLKPNKWCQTQSSPLQHIYQPRHALPASREQHFVHSSTC
jgi:hypothetical protein